MTDQELADKIKEMIKDEGKCVVALRDLLHIWFSVQRVDETTFHARARKFNRVYGLDCLYTLQNGQPVEARFWVVKTPELLVEKDGGSYIV